MRSHDRQEGERQRHDEPECACKTHDWVSIQRKERAAWPVDMNGPLSRIYVIHLLHEPEVSTLPGFAGTTSRARLGRGDMVRQSAHLSERRYSPRPCGQLGNLVD